MLRVSDLVIEVTDLAGERIGQVELSYFTKMQLIKRFRNVGAWSITLPANYWLTQALMSDGHGIIVTADFKISGVQTPVVLMSGPMISSSQDKTTTDLDGVVTITGVDRMIHLADALAWPQPSNSNSSTQNVGYDVRSGMAETVMKAYVNANIGVSAPSARRIYGMMNAIDQGRGVAVTGRARFDNLGGLLTELASVSGLGFDVIQTDNDYVFDVYEISDKTDVVRMDIVNDTLKDITISRSAPTVTRAIVAGQGQLEARRILQVTDAEATAAEAAWGRKIEVFRDRRDTAEDAELIQSGNELILAGGRTINSLVVKPSDNGGMDYITDWFIGDLIGVVVDDQELTATVSSSIISLDNNELTIMATIGDPTGFNFEARMVANQSSQEARISSLERNDGVNEGTGNLDGGEPGTIYGGGVIISGGEP